MDSKGQASEAKQRDLGSKVCCIIGAGVWWFLCSQPSSFALALAAFVVFYLFLGYFLLAVLLPGPEIEGSKEAFVPLPQSDVNRPKALTY